MLTTGVSSISLDSEQFASLVALEGSVRLVTKDHVLEVNAGRTAFIPASAACTRVEGQGRAVVIEPATAKG